MMAELTGVQVFWISVGIVASAVVLGLALWSLVLMYYQNLHKGEPKGSDYRLPGYRLPRPENENHRQES